MLTNLVKDREYIYSVCRSTDDISCGAVFQNFKIADDEGTRINTIPKTNIICCGNLNENQKLFRTEDGRYYFGLTDGWGSEEGTLFGIRLGLFYDFGHPTTFEAALNECDSLGTYSSWAGAMKYHHDKSMLKLLRPVIKRLKEN